MSENTTTPEPVDAKTPAEEQATEPAEPSAVAAAQAEVTGRPVVVEFEGHEYEIPAGPVSPMAVTYAAVANTTGDMYSLVLYMQELFGPVTWRDWCMRHQTNQILDFAKLADAKVAEAVGIRGN